MSQQIIRTQYLSFSLLSLIHEVKVSYLSEDLEAICDIASRTGETMLIASAGLDIEHRQRVFELWHTKRIDALKAACQELRELIATDPAIDAALYAGTADFAEIDQRIGRIVSERQEREQQHKQQRKHALKNAVIRHTHNSDGTFRTPGVLAVRSDGEIKLFNTETNGKRWGTENGHSCYTFEIDRASVRMRHGGDW